jgi:hypothetical protein
LMPNSNPSRNAKYLHNAPFYQAFSRKTLPLDSTTVPTFIADRCIRDSKATSWMKQLYVAYCTWSNENGFTRVQQQPTVKRNLEQLGFTIKHGNQGDKVIGLKLK